LNVANNNAQLCKRINYLKREPQEEVAAPTTRVLIQFSTTKAISAFATSRSCRTNSFVVI